ncbi:FMN phosphatase YigB (HAD superfamily) [Dokdonella fugitiva]|nr:FMN phosphatase YigB (HAD superfamily) [Dokdonella fugitiva]
MIELVGFDGDDTLWHSEGYYQHAGAEFERIVSAYIDVADASVRARLHAVERRNLVLFGYGAKGMTLSMIEAAIDVTAGRIASRDIHRIVELGRAILDHPVELLDGIRAAVEDVASRHRIVLVTKGDLFHQEPQSYSCRVRARHHKALKTISSVPSRRRKRRRACGPVRLVVAHSCPGFATIMEAA